MDSTRRRHLDVAFDVRTHFDDGELGSRARVIRSASAGARASNDNAFGTRCDPELDSLANGECGELDALPGDVVPLCNVRVQPTDLIGFSSSNSLSIGR
jgi:hypothetical protein